MRIDDSIRKCVGFVTIEDGKGGYRPIGTYFYVASRTEAKTKSYAVTARHVIDYAISKGNLFVFIRLNMEAGGLRYYRCECDKWIGHDDPTVDLVVFPMGIGAGNDHYAFPTDMLFDKAVIDEFELTLGREVFVTGLFRHHHGERKNIPIVRVGTIAALDEEQVQTDVYLRDAYLIECRSIGGLSGSPVYIQIEPQLMLQRPTPPTKPPGTYLLGVIHGHFDSNVSTSDMGAEDAGLGEKVNTGIAIVTPAEKLKELLAQEDVLSRS